MVGETGFEPATLWSQTRCATRLRHSPTPAFLGADTASVNEQLGRGLDDRVRVEPIGAVQVGQVTGLAEAVDAQAG